jgi:DNA polymerase-3 subunit alpha
MAGLLSSRTYKTTRNNEQMGFLTIEDLFGVYEVIVFARVLDKVRSLLDEGRAYLISGRISSREDEAPKLIADDLVLLEPQMDRLPWGWARPEQGSGQTRSAAAEPALPVRTRLCLRYFGLEYDAGYKRLLATLQYFHGQVPVRVYFVQEERLVELDPAYAISLDDKILQQLAARYGAENLALL